MTSSIFGFSRFTKEMLEHFSLAQSTKEFLQVVGLPCMSSPRLGFGDFDGVFLPRLKDWPWLKHTPPKEYGAYIVIGTDGSDNPICIIEGSEHIVCLDQDKAFEWTFMNSSVLQLAATVNSHQSLVDEAMCILDDEYSVGRIPHTLIEKFEEEVAKLDSSALTHGAFWANEIAQLKEETKKFECLEKYSFKLYSKRS